MNPVKPVIEAPVRQGEKLYDPLLDPLPQPEVVESNTDTAWGRWEDLVQAGDVRKDDGPKGPDFEDTVPMGS